MGLVDLRTDLKSLRYGKDRLGGGNSNQPYITKKIPDDLGDLNKTGGSDFLLRGGSLVVNRTIDDVSRLAKMFIDTKSLSGIFFTAKQLVLSRQAAKTQASPNIFNDGIYLPTSTLAQSGINALGGHLYKQGILPFKKTNRDSLFGQPSYSENLNYIKENSTNRLISFTSGSSGIIGNSNINITSYSGGPGSILGIGKTNIKRTTNTSDAFNFLNTPLGQTYNASAFSYSQIQSQNTTDKNKIKSDFRSDLITPPTVQNQSNLPKTTADYINNNIETRVNLNSPGRVGNKSSFVKGKALGNIQQGALDKINALPIYKSETATTHKNADDLIPFRIGIIDNDNPREKTYIHFRAFIKGLNDNYSADWSSIKYVGRGEEFYRYGGFSRSVNLSWTVVAQSKEELIPMYQKLNYLASATAPDYSTSSGYMRGNLITLTIGDWFNEQVGIFKGINITVPDDSPWEIALDEDGENNSDKSVKQMPHRIEVSGFEFTPIHNFVPQKQKLKFEEGTYNNIDNDYVSSFGQERYINLSSPNGNSYGQYPSGDLNDGNFNYTPKTAAVIKAIDDVSNLNFNF